MPKSPRNNDAPGQSPWLFFPYDSADTGEVRPYPAVPAWMCQAILVNGLPYTGAALLPGTTLNLSLVIRNRGATEGLITARLYAAPPAPIFTHAYLSSWQVGSGWVLPVYPSLPGGPPLPTITTPSIPWEVPAGIGHVCLIAEIICSADPPILPEPDPANDRHYGQQNLSVIMMAKSQRSGFTFFAVNPLDEPATAMVRASPAGGEVLRFMSQVYRAEAIQVDRRAISVYVVHPGARTSGQRAAKLELKPKESRLCQLMIESPEQFEPHQFFVIEIEQTIRENGQHEAPFVPTLGVVVFGKSD